MPAAKQQAWTKPPQPTAAGAREIVPTQPRLQTTRTFSTYRASAGSKVPGIFPNLAGLLTIANALMTSGSKMDQETVPRRSFVIMSGYHDYRSKRKADLHFIADQLKKQGEVSFLSLRYSYFRLYKKDPSHT